MFHDSCNICGKPYRTCKHYRKEHLPNAVGEAICGKTRNVSVLPSYWKEIGIHPNDICKQCKKLSGLLRENR